MKITRNAGLLSALSLLLVVLCGVSLCQEAVAPSLTIVTVQRGKEYRDRAQVVTASNPKTVVLVICFRGPNEGRVLVSPTDLASATLEANGMTFGIVTGSFVYGKPDKHSKKAQTSWQFIAAPVPRSELKFTLKIGKYAPVDITVDEKVADTLNEMEMVSFSPTQQ